VSCCGGWAAFTSSWDHSIKVWDLEKQDCLTTLIGSKVTTSLAFSAADRLLASGHPDGRIRLWDARTPTVPGESSPAKRTLASCKSWISRCVHRGRPKRVAFGKRCLTRRSPCVYGQCYLAPHHEPRACVRVA
jgi:WD40 repeat protein